MDLKHTTSLVILTLSVFDKSNQPFELWSACLVADSDFHVSLSV